MDECFENLNSALFKGISSEELKVMLGCLGYHTGNYKKGEIVFHEGAELRHIGVVLSGAVDIVKEDIMGDRNAYARIFCGEVFGMAFACGTDRQTAVSYVAAEDSKLLFLPIERVMNSCDNSCRFHQKLVVNLAMLIADESRKFVNKLEIVTKRSIREKLLTYLYAQSQQKNNDYFEIPLGRIELADFLCVDRSALTRELAKLKKEGLVDYDRNCFRVMWDKAFEQLNKT